MEGHSISKDELMITDENQISSDDNIIDLFYILDINFESKVNQLRMGMRKYLYDCIFVMMNDEKFLTLLFEKGGK